MSESRNGNAADVQSTQASLRELHRVPEVNAEPGFVMLGELLHGMRRAKGWSRRQLSEVANIDPDTISNVELAVHVPRQETLRRLALALIEPVEAWSTERCAEEDERQSAYGRAGSTDRAAHAVPAVEHAAWDTGSPVAASAARDGFVLVERTIVTTETWRASEQRAVPERIADGDPPAS